MPPLVVDATHPLCRDVRPGDGPWLAAGLAGESPAAVLISAGDQPLYWREPDGRLCLDVALDTAPLVYSAAWPVMMANLVAETGAMLPGLAVTQYRPGQPLEYRAEPGAGRRDLRLEAMDGGEPVAGPAGLAPRRAGRYRLLRGAAAVGELAMTPEYGAAADLQSALAEDAVIRAGDAGGRADGVTDLSWLAAALGLVCVSLNWRRAVRRGE